MITKKLNWFVLYTAPRAEKRVQEQVEGAGIECYLPLHRRPRVWSDRIKLVDVPLFNSYVFVKCKHFQLFSLLRVTGVLKIVFYNDQPAIIRQREIDAVKKFLEKAKEKALCTGDEVEILAGSLKKISGKIVKIKKRHILLHIEQLAATVCVDLENVAHVDRLR
jgi:transcription antitermination factor NusG